MKSLSLALRTGTGALLLAFLLALPTSRAMAVGNVFNEAPTMCFTHSISETIVCWVRYKTMAVVIEYQPGLRWNFYKPYKP